MSTEIVSTEALSEQPVVEQTAQLDAGWSTTQQISISMKAMDQIVADYMSAHMHMDGSTKVIHERFISTIKGHGFKIKIYGGNIQIHKCARSEQ